MRVALMTLTVVAAVCAGAAGAQSVQQPDDQFPTEQLTGSNQLLTHDCADGQYLTLNGSSNRISLTGNCLSIAITGSSNIVTSLQPLNVSAIGSNNQVNWPKTPAEPHLHFEGSGNTAGPQKG